MDIIAQARELAKEIQKDERYLALQLAQQQNDEDKELGLPSASSTWCG